MVDIVLALLKLDCEVIRSWPVERVISRNTGEFGDLVKVVIGLSIEFRVIEVHANSENARVLRPAVLRFHSLSVEMKTSFYRYYKSCFFWDLSNYFVDLGHEVADHRELQIVPT